MKNGEQTFYKKDWDEAKERMTAWWEGQRVDRPIALVHAPVDPAKPLRSEPINAVPRKYTDPDTVFNNLDYRLERTYWGGEAFPHHFVYFGPLFVTAFMGGKPNFTPRTTYYDPVYKNIDDMGAIEFDSQNRWWQAYREMTLRSVQRSKGRYLTTISSIAAVIDMICALLGNEEALMAMAQNPDALKNVRDRISQWGKSTYEELFDIIAPQNDGIIDWLGVWCHKKIRTTQCDACVMFSTDMFRDYVRDDLTSTYDYVDYGLYHLDGEEQIRHLDMLLSIENLRVVQWVPSHRAQPGYQDALSWIELFKRIQDSGKSVLISHCRPEDVDVLLSKLARDQVILNIGCPDVASAEKVLAQLDRIGV